MTYNGSILPIHNTNLHLCAYRATIKPESNESAPFPYTNLNYNIWFNKGNYIGLAFINLIDRKIYNYYKYIHNIHPNMSNYKYVQYLKKINNIENKSLEFNNLLAGPEDPRLYYKNKKIFMNYNNIVVSPTAACQAEFLGMFEIHIDINILLNNSKKFYPDTKKQLICSKVNGKPLFTGKKSSKTLKNWSYAPGFFIDSYKDKTFLYTNSRINDCKRIPYIHTLQPFIQKNWSISLTTPTVEIKQGSFLYGVAHIRIPWKDIALIASDNNSDISDKLKEIIYQECLDRVKAHI